MNCVLFAKMDQIFSLEKKTRILKKYLKNRNEYCKSQELCQPRKVESMYTCIYMYKYVDQKSLSCHAGHQEVSRCHTRDESEESIAHR